MLLFAITIYLEFLWNWSLILLLTPLLISIFFLLKNIFFFFLPVSLVTRVICLGCCNRITQVGLFMQRKCISSQFWKVKDQGAIGVGFWWKLLPGLWMTDFFLCSVLPSSLCAYREREKEQANSGVSFSSYKDTSLIKLGPHFYDLI